MFCNTHNLDNQQLNGRFPKFDVTPRQQCVDKIDTLFHQFYKRRHDDTYTTFQRLISNLHLGDPIIVVMNRTHHSEHKKFGFHPAIVDQVHHLLKHEPKLAIRDKGCREWKRASYVEATEEFHELFDDLVVDYLPPELVVVREWIDQGYKKEKLNDAGRKYEVDVAKPHNLKFTATAHAQHVEGVLKRYNLFMLDHKVIIPGKRNNLQCSLRAIYNNDLQHGGRLFTATGDGVQSHRKNDRLNILIDGNEVIEADWKSFHPNSMRSKSGLSPLDDCYGDVVDAIPNLDSRDFTTARNLVKLVTQRMINCESKLSASKAAYYVMNQVSPIKYNLESALLSSLELTVYDLIDIITKVHDSISSYFFTSYGSILQELDSRMSIMIIEYCLEHDIVVLPVHDSFIVDARLQAELCSIMNHAYCEVLKVDTPCPIKIMNNHSATHHNT